MRYLPQYSILRTPRSFIGASVLFLVLSLIPKTLAERFDLSLISEERLNSLLSLLLARVEHFYNEDIVLQLFVTLLQHNKYC